MDIKKLFNMLTGGLTAAQFERVVRTEKELNDTIVNTLGARLTPFPERKVMRVSNPTGVDITAERFSYKVQPYQEQFVKFLEQDPTDICAAVHKHLYGRK